MPKYVIERNMPGAGNLTPEELKEGAKKSCDVLNTMGTEIQWVHSYFTDINQTLVIPLYIVAAEFYLQAGQSVSFYPFREKHRVAVVGLRTGHLRFTQ